MSKVKCPTCETQVKLIPLELQDEDCEINDREVYAEALLVAGCEECNEELREFELQLNKTFKSGDIEHSEECTEEYYDITNWSFDDPEETKAGFEVTLYVVVECTGCNQDGEFIQKETIKPSLMRQIQ